MVRDSSVQEQLQKRMGADGGSRAQAAHRLDLPAASLAIHHARREDRRPHEDPGASSNTCWLSPATASSHPARH
jgi:hypothetical protein